MKKHRVLKTILLSIFLPIGLIVVGILTWLFFPIGINPSNMVCKIESDGESIKYNDNIKEVIIYPRGNDYCYTIGSIADKNMQTYFLNENEVNKVNDLLQNNTLSKVIKSNRKTLTLDGNTASIEYAGKKYNATDIIKTLKQNDINVNQIATSEWERLLKGQGLQLNKSKKAIFSITKTPSGYNMKVMNIAKNSTKINGIEAEA